MDINFNNGSLYMINGDQTVPLGVGAFTEEIELSANETPAVKYNLMNSASMEFEVSGLNIELLNSFCLPYSGEAFTLQYERPIMIQARWHKKPRINKKWLKRFGMKKDTVQVDTSANAINYNPIDGSFDFEATQRKYILRPDQERNGIKIEW